MPGRSRPKDGRRFRSAYVPGIHVLTFWLSKKDVDGRDKPGHDEL